VIALAEELVARRVDVIVTAGTLSGSAARTATNQIPIVLTTGGDPVLMGLVPGLANPGGNITGINLLTELGVKRLELLRELLPGISRVAVLWNVASPSARRQADELKAVGPTLGLSIELVGVGHGSDLEPAFASVAADAAQAVVVITSPFFFDQRERLASLAIQYRLPLALGFREYAEAGALVAYGTDLRFAFRRAADYVDRILKGVKPSDLPIEQPTALMLILNLKTAEALGIAIPPTLLARADEVIE